MRRLQTFPPSPAETRRVHPKRPPTMIAGLHRLFAIIHNDPRASLKPDLLVSFRRHSGIPALLSPL